MSLLGFKIKGRVEVGCDEAGRGCLSGPVVAAAVILPNNFRCPLLNDSKKMSKKNREYLEEYIKSKAISWGVGVVSNQEIDEINILNASFLAMHRAIDKLDIIPEAILVDGNRFNPYKDIHHECIIKGDGIYKSIAAASILAKTYRDKIMEELHTEFPVYNWKQNKGYPSKFHRAMIAENGITSHHRLSFKLKTNK